ncbi:alpha-D-ribose 1-methylphosphonate 5-triphosphate diphosphatase [Donghicola tyrosinivorans]|uniref:Alpha-D-ribose 1-methylphosphonate 5-triphosphate diphosphatase n=1 Tax=Donghicola tyrosinivorans TaxID=1652492 RepID=A0A2T0X0G5_9RHOB|nr:alpha-D-ribose 1-methylphosphonate 5-triphosphate diphosphatase [Donghicola tyrosinivorans]PRY92436.1 alpha-D-ribose 1-methylphosphonate 5-triphosphate diphosphatase [Donghicola tyrosinivorans]
MTKQSWIFAGAQVIGPDGVAAQDVSVADGLIVDQAEGRRVDLSGWTLAPGIVDVHGDGFERHVAVRRGALTAMENGLIAVEAELAANGITTAVLAQFFSWEGGMRGPEFAEKLVDAWLVAAPQVSTDLRLQLRLETNLIDRFDEALALIDRAGIGYVVFNDHLPHDRLAQGRKPPRLTGQALKSGRSPEAHLALMQRLHAQVDKVPAALAEMAEKLLARGVRLGSHDDGSAEDRAEGRALGAKVSEFPESIEAAAAARDHDEVVVMGAPNIVRGASHAGNVSAREIVRLGLCDALASDYHYPSPRYAALSLVEEGICDLASAWRLLSEGPARALGLEDRGVIASGKRADLVIFDAATGRVGATIAGGEITYLTHPLARRFLA